MGSVSKNCFTKIRGFIVYNKVRISRKRSQTKVRAEEQQQQKNQPQILKVYYEAQDIEEDFSQENSSKSLKINRDLLLYRSREFRKQYKQEPDRKVRQDCLLKAEELARKVMDMDPQDARAYVTLGNILLLQRRIEDAIQIYEQGCRVTEGKNAFIWASWAYLEGRRGNIQLARKYFEAATTADKTHAAAWHGWAIIEKKQGNYLRARNLLLKGIQQCKSSPKGVAPHLYQSMGVLAFQMGLLDEARKWLQTGVKTVRGNMSIAMWHTWALLEAEAGNDQMTIALFKKAVSMSQKSRYILLSWGLWELNRGRIEVARQLIRDGCLQNPSDVPLLQVWGILEAKTGSIENARILFNRAREIDPEHIPAYHAWAILEFSQGRFQESRQLFQEAVQIAKNRTDLVYCYQAWGCVEAKLENYALARDLFKCGLRLDPQNDPTWVAWINMEENLGLFNRAQEIRLLRTQQRVNVTDMTNFSTLQQEPSLRPVIDKISSWFNPLRQDSEQYGDVQAENDIISQIIDNYKDDQDDLGLDPSSQQ